MQDKMNEVEAEEKNPLDSMIATVEGMIQDPKTATPEALKGLLSDLQDMRGYLDSEEPVKDEGWSETDSGKKPSLMIMIGRERGGK